MPGSDGHKHVVGGKAMIAEGRLDQVLTIGKEYLVKALSPTHALFPGRLKRHGLFVKELRRCITDANAMDGAERGELNVLSQRVELPAVHAFDHAGRNEIARTRDGARRLADITRVVEKRASRRYQVALAAETHELPKFWSCDSS